MLRGEPAAGREIHLGNESGDRKSHWTTAPHHATPRAPGRQPIEPEPPPPASPARPIVRSSTRTSQPSRELLVVVAS
jgi:hypothetical protein